MTHDVAISGGHQTNLAALLEATSSETMIANSVPEPTHLECFKCWPGINNEMLHLLKLFLSSLDPEDRVCGVLADEIKLAEAISWSARLKTVFKAHKV